MSDAQEELHHHTRVMRGRDPHQAHRVATPLELLFDLTFVIAYGIAASELAHALAAGHIGAGIGGFLYACFAISWAWINFAWFASAYDVDDWSYRLLTMVQMVGVLIVALGLPAMFESWGHEHFDVGAMVLGYVVMRVPMVAQWMRAARQDPGRRHASNTYILSIVISQIGWCALLLFHLSVGAFLAIAAVPLALEMYGPIVAEFSHGGAPWHAHHIAERYGLIVIIALGEGLIGTMATLGALVGPEGPGWSLDIAVLGLSGTALTFGMWWTYFIVPWGEILAAYRARSFGWGYGHIALFAAIVAVGAGLHVAASAIEHHCVLSLPKTLLCVAIPVGAYIALLYILYSVLTRAYDPFHTLLLLLSVLPLGGSVVLACTGIGLPWCIVALAVTPWISVVGYELRGHRYNEHVVDVAHNQPSAR